MLNRTRRSLLLAYPDYVNKARGSILRELLTGNVFERFTWHRKRPSQPRSPLAVEAAHAGRFFTSESGVVPAYGYGTRKGKAH